MRLCRPAISNIRVYPPDWATYGNSNWKRTNVREGLCWGARGHHLLQLILELRYPLWFWCKRGNGSASGDNGQMTTASPSLDLFKGRHFDQEIIVLCARWYLSFKLSSRDLVRMMAERGVVLAHTT